MTTSVPNTPSAGPSEDALLHAAFAHRKNTLRIYWGLLTLPVLGVALLLGFGRSDLQQVRVVASAAVAPAEAAYREIQPRLVAVGRLDTVLPQLDSALPLLAAVSPRLNTVEADARATTQRLATQGETVQRLQADLTNQAQELTRIRAALANLPSLDVANLATVEQLRGLRDQLSRIERQQQVTMNAVGGLRDSLATSVQRLSGRIDALSVNRRPDLNRIP